MNHIFTEASELPTISTIGEELADGSVIELVKNDHTIQPNLLIWNGIDSLLAERLEHRGAVYVPREIDPTVVRGLHLPSSASEYGTTAKLFSELEELISRATSLPEATVQRLTFFVIATWFADQLPQAPFLWIVAPPTASTESIRQLLPLVCRRVLWMSGLSLTILRSLPMELRPTIGVEATVVTQSLLKALCASNRRGSYIPSGKKILDVSCAKIVIASQPLRDPAAAGFPLEVTLTPSRTFGPSMSTAEAERVAHEFQGKLLMYRLRSLGKLVPPALDLSEFTAPTQELATTLATCIVGGDKLRSQIVSLLKERDQEIQVDRTSILESIVIEGLLAACHRLKRRNVSVVELTQNVNTILRARGGSLEVSPEHVGWRLRALGLHTTFLTGGRKGIALVDATCSRVHTLASAYGVRTIRTGGVPSENCKFCRAA